MPSVEFHLEKTDDRLPVLTDSVRRRIEEMPKLEAEEDGESDDGQFLEVSMASMISCFLKIRETLISIQETATACGKTNKLKDLAESYNDQVVAFETSKGRIAQALHDISDALIKEIEPHRQHVELVHLQLNTPSKEISYDLPHVIRVVRPRAARSVSKRARSVSKRSD
ncbi:unnamed protein product [Linum tenue]|uniref:BLOC-1-related complex subunit 5 n=1 Tax=Linum tenue TaxID=586396 RepID=A0AAV0IIE4_9ROSI|nr:unnamed protein product [Linum tenue]